MVEGLKMSKILRIGQKTKQLYRSFFEAVLISAGAQLSLWALGVTTDKTVYLCRHVFAALVHFVGQLVGR